MVNVPLKTPATPAFSFHPADILEHLCQIDGQMQMDELLIIF